MTDQAAFIVELCSNEYWCLILAHLTSEEMCFLVFVEQWWYSTRVVPRVWDDKCEASHVPFPILPTLALPSAFPEMSSLKVGPFALHLALPSIVVLSSGQHALLIEPTRSFGKHCTLWAISETHVRVLWCAANR